MSIRLRETKISWIVESDGFSPYVSSEPLIKVAFKKNIFSKSDIRKIVEMGVNNYVDQVFIPGVKKNNFVRILERRTI